MIEKKFEALIEALEDINYHNDVAILDALQVQNYDAIIALSVIAKQHKKQGYLSNDLAIFRDKICNEIEGV